MRLQAPTTCVQECKVGERVGRAGGHLFQPLIPPTLHYPAGISFLARPMSGKDGAAHQSLTVPLRFHSRNLSPQAGFPLWVEKPPELLRDPTIPSLCWEDSFPNPGCGCQL